MGPHSNGFPNMRITFEYFAIERMDCASFLFFLFQVNKLELLRTQNHRWLRNTSSSLDAILCYFFSYMLYTIQHKWLCDHCTQYWFFFFFLKKASSLLMKYTVILQSHTQRIRTWLRWVDAVIMGPRRPSNHESIDTFLSHQGCSNYLEACSALIISGWFRLLGRFRRAPEVCAWHIF